MIQPCMADSPRRRTPGVSGPLRVSGGEVGESAHHERLVRGEHHPESDGGARQPYQRRRAWGGAFANPSERNSPREASFSSGTAANTRVAPRFTNRSRDSATRVPASPCRRKAASTARKYT